MPANEGQRRPTRTNRRPNAGQRRPTKANAGPRWPTTASEGQRRPKTAHKSQRRPMQAHDGQHRPNDGQRRPTTANAPPTTTYLLPPPLIFHHTYVFIVIKYILSCTKTGRDRSKPVSRPQKTALNRSLSVRSGFFGISKFGRPVSVSVLAREGQRPRPDRTSKH